MILSPRDSAGIDSATVVPDSLPGDSVSTDSTTASVDERDTLWGEQIVASFGDVDSAGTIVSRLRLITAIGTAASLFSRNVDRGATVTPSITYTRADTIVIVMRTDDTTGVLEVRARRGAEPVDGVQLERASLRRPAIGAARREDSP